MCLTLRVSRRHCPIVVKVNAALRWIASILSFDPLADHKCLVEQKNKSHQDGKHFKNEENDRYLQHDVDEEHIV